jgi:hypothetical protein
MEIEACFFFEIQVSDAAARYQGEISAIVQQAQNNFENVISCYLGPHYLSGPILGVNREEDIGDVRGIGIIYRRRFTFCELASSEHCFHFHGMGG